MLFSVMGFPFPSLSAHARREETWYWINCVARGRVVMAEDDPPPRRDQSPGIQNDLATPDGKCEYIFFFVST